MFSKPAMAIGTMAASEPPQIIASALPRRMIAAASPMVCVPVAQAVAMA